MRKLLVLVLLLGFVTLGQAGVMFQTFYWGCWDGTQEWWDNVAKKMNELGKAGITAIWIPNSLKAASGGYSMGYDPYDHYDLGSKLQAKPGATPERGTHWGQVEQLRRLVALARANGIDVYHDMVLNHLNGDWGGSKTFQYVNWNGEANKGRFSKGPADFHDKDSVLDDTSFGPDLNYYNGYTYSKTLEWGDWLVKSLGIQGFRFDYVKGLPYKTDSNPNFWFQHNFLTYGAMSGKFSVSEYADDNRDTLNWFNAQTSYKSSVFDFSLRGQLKALCDGNGYYDLRGLRWAGLVGINPAAAVTWVENHDTHPNHEKPLRPPIISNKILGYAYILTHEGYPCVAYGDYYGFNMKNAINSLVWVHEKLAGGSTAVLSGTDNSWSSFYAMQRGGYGSNPGLVLVINGNGSTGQSRWVKTKWNNTKLHVYSWSGVQPIDKWTDGSGWVELWADKMSYAVYAPDGRSGSFTPPQWSTVQEFHGADDLDIAPLTATQREAAKFYAQAGKAVKLELWYDKASWTASTSGTMRLKSGATTLSTKSFTSATTQPATITYTPATTGWFTVTMQGASLPAANAKPKFWLKNTYTAPQTLP